MMSLIARAIGASCLVAVMTIGHAAALDDGFETPPVFSAKDRLPGELLTGPSHRIDDRVTNDGFMNHFVIHSDFGITDRFEYDGVDTTDNIYSEYYSDRPLWDDFVIR